MIRARSTRLAGSVREREISNKRCRCPASLGNTTIRRGATMDSPNPIPRPPLTNLAKNSKIERNMLIFRNLCTGHRIEPTTKLV
jgi:hypothetical protein